MNNYSQSAPVFDLKSAALCDKAVSTLPLKERPQVQGSVPKSSINYCSVDPPVWRQYDKLKHTGP